MGGLMVSNNEIKQILSERRQGIFRNGYLVCDTCQGVYELKDGEKPDDFSEECECGGHLSYTRTLELGEEDPDEDFFDSPTLNWLSKRRNILKIRIVLSTITFLFIGAFLLIMILMK